MEEFIRTNELKRIEDEAENEKFIESNELERIKKEAEEIRKELRHLLFLKTPEGKKTANINETDNINEKIKKKRNELYIHEVLIARYIDEFGDEENDRYKTNKRK